MEEVNVVLKSIEDEFSHNSMEESECIVVLPGSGKCEYSSHTLYSMGEVRVQYYICSTHSTTYLALYSSYLLYI